MADQLVIDTVEMHTAGEPVRIVVAGYPPLEGETILAKRAYARAHHDDLRRLLMHEPRGHADMYGVLLVERDDPRADLAVLFTHNEGYSTMCGHAVIALGRWAVDTGLVEATPPETTVHLQVPSGLVRAVVTSGEDGNRWVRFESVPAFAAFLDVEVEVSGHGPVTVDVGYGGAFYAVLPASRLGLDLVTSPLAQLVDAAERVAAATRRSVEVEHPTEPDLAYLYGAILTDGKDDYGPHPTRNLCVFADRSVDRSPTGSGVTARLALQWSRGQIGLGQVRTFLGPTGAPFRGRVVRAVDGFQPPAVIAEVGGEAFYTGTARFTYEPADPLPAFLVR